MASEFPCIGDNYLLGFELQGCTDANITVAGHSVISSADDCRELLEGYELFADVAPTGFYDMESTEETRLASHFLHALVTELQVVVGIGPSWTAMQTSTRGRALNKYKRTASALALTRERSDYEKLRTLPASESANVKVAAIATINLANDGYLESFDGSESIAVEEDKVIVAESESELHVDFIGMMPRARKAPILANSSKRAIGELSNAARMRTLLLQLARCTGTTTAHS